MTSFSNDRRRLRSRVRKSWKKILGGLLAWKYWDPSLENIFWPLGCLKIAKFWKIKENWKILIFQLLRAVAPKRKMQIGWFFAQWFTRPVWKRWWKKISKIVCRFWEKLTFAKGPFSQKPVLQNFWNFGGS